MSDLKPCPFCTAALVWSDTYSEYHHPVAKCILSGHKFKKGMIGQWNRRALPAVQTDAAALQEEAEIDALRVKAFRTNAAADRDAYFAAVSGWFQNRHGRALPAVQPDLTDPVVVHANMLRGTIAKPTLEQIRHMYGDAVQPDAAATREEVAKALWRADQYQGQIRLSFTKAESYIRNHWLKLADVAIEKIKGEKK